MEDRGPWELGEASPAAPQHQAQPTGRVALEQDWQRHHVAAPLWDRLMDLLRRARGQLLPVCEPRWTLDRASR